MVDPVSASIPFAPSDAPPKNAAEAAREFEALLIAQILNAAHEESSEEDTSANTMWSLGAQQFSRIMAERGGFGLARMIERSLGQPPARAADSV